MTVLEQVVTSLKPMIRGVIHVGAHVANEAAVYDGIPDVLWVEGNHEVFDELSRNVGPRGHRAVLAMLSDSRSKRNFHVMSGDGGSSSLHRPTRHLKEYPSITLDHVTEVETTTLDDLIDEVGSYANMLVIDTQGHEMHVLRGGVKHIDQFDIIIAEGYTAPLYEGATTSGELCIQLLYAGYAAVAYSEGDLLFVKQKLLQVTNEGH